jgi:predicted dinucleotide-binding enzyme
MTSRALPAIGAGIALADARFIDLVTFRRTGVPVGTPVLFVIDCGNPRADRDGPMADEAISKGTGVASAEYLPGVRLVRAFNALSAVQVEREAHRAGEKIGVPIAADDAEATQVVSELVVDAGFDPVVVGPLARARDFDRGTAVYVRGLTAAQLREALGLR